MHGDFSRSTFSERHGFRAVQLQQGRVLLDAEWNEQAALTAHHDEVRTLDMVGRSGGPLPEGGGAGPFALVEADGSPVTGAAWADLVVTPGRYYVDGVLAESFAPATGVGWPLGDQPHLPAIGSANPGLAEPPASPDGTRYALYLEVGEQHVTADDEPWLRESALGGPDTATRVRTTWQVRWTPLAPAEVCLDLHAAGWLARTPRTMIAALRPPEADADPCRITTKGGYQRLENQLYRVQIHDDGSAGGPATFVWSRENGSVVSTLLTITPSDLPDVDHVLGQDRVGRDDELSVREHDLVEVTSTTRQLRGQPGFLARAGAPNGLDLPVTWLASRPTSLASLGRTPIVRRWEGGPEPVTTVMTDLEDGITVRFPAGGTPAVGDHWLIPARTVRLAYGVSGPPGVGGTIEWPPTPDGPMAALPAGPVRHVAPLAVLERTAGVWSLVADCRCLFPPLTGLAAIDLVGGDGQEDLPGEWLDQAVRVVVRTGATPVVGAPVEFVVPDGGDLADALPAGPPVPAGLPLVLVTGSDGVAAVRWRPLPTGPTTQRLHVQRLDGHGDPTGVAVVATARLSVSTEVAWSRPACAGFSDVSTVDGALDRMVERLELRLRGGDGQHLEPGTLVLPQPIRVIVDNACGPVGNVPINALSFGAALVAPAVEGDAVPTDLAGTGGVTADSISTADGGALFWWQPDLTMGTDRLEIRLPGEDLHAPITVTAQRVERAGRPGVHLHRLAFGTNVEFGNDTDVEAETLVTGIFAELDGEIAVEAVRDKPVVRVELELPWPFRDDGGLWSKEVIGTRSVTLDGDVQVDNKVIIWRPRRCREWVRRGLWNRLAEGGWDEPILGRYFLEGWAVPTVEPKGLQVNTHFDVIDDAGRVAAILPTDNLVTGGTFVHWFRLRGEADLVRAVIPDLSGRTLAVARRRLEALGFTVEVTRQPVPGATRGQVTSVEPPPGEEVAVGSVVVVTVAT